MLKGFMDGSLGSRTAAMKAPYSDDPGNTGLPQYSKTELDKMAVERTAIGFQLGFHAIGDKAVAMALDAFEKVKLLQYSRRFLHSVLAAPPASPIKSGMKRFPVRRPALRQNRPLIYAG